MPPKHKTNEPPKPRLIDDFVRPDASATDKTAHSSHLHRNWPGPITRVPRWVLVLAIVAIIVAWGLTLIKWPGHHSSTKSKTVSAFPAVTAGQITSFKFYYFRPGFQTDYTLQPSTIAYQAGVLIFNMEGPLGNSLAITEEKLPPHFDVSSISANTQIATSSGEAYISSSAAQTTGSLITTDNTWVIINSPQAISSGVMQQMLDALTPTKQ